MHRRQEQFVGGTYFLRCLPSNICTMFMRASYTVTRYMYLYISCRGEEYGAGPASLTSEDYLSADELPMTDVSGVADPSILFQRADNMMEGTDTNKEDAYNLLKGSAEKVRGLTGKF